MGASESVAPLEAPRQSGKQHGAVSGFRSRSQHGLNAEVQGELVRCGREFLGGHRQRLVSSCKLTGEHEKVPQA